MPQKKPNDPIILLAHGGGGIYTQNLMRDIILRHLGNPELECLDDSACLSIPETELAFTTDSYVINPLFFPGGDIGKLAACGTINDLVMQGAEPRYMSLALILEEGLPISDLEQAIQSLAGVVRPAGVKVVTGDTKVVERGHGSGMFVNTSGIGLRMPGTDTAAGNARPDDVIIINGTIGDHGAAVMSRRLGLQSSLQSDVAPLHELVLPLLQAGLEIHCLRDPTRGGVAAALCDIAGKSRVSIRLNERDLPVKAEVNGVCQILGMDPLNMANEGKALMVCPQTAAAHILARLKKHPLGKNAAIIGKVCQDNPGLVLLETKAGGERIIRLPLGEDLPRIC